MNPIRCLIIEDEPLAAEVLEDYVKALPQLELVGICPDAIYALELMQRTEVDLMFLDIHLPRLKGLDFLRSLPHPPKVILTTAYHQYALEGYEHDVVDYLLKPIEFSRFVKAVNKLQPQQVSSPSQTLPSPSPPYRFVNVNKRQVKVVLADILFIESLKEYAHIHTETETIITKAQLGELETLFQEANLLRVHRSYVVAKEKIQAFSSNEIEIGEYRIPIGRTYQREVLKELSKT